MRAPEAGLPEDEPSRVGLWVFVLVALLLAGLQAATQTFAALVEPVQPPDFGEVFAPWRVVVWAWRGYEQAPVTGSHELIVHASLSSQTTGVPGTQPVTGSQVSTPLHA